MRKNKNIPMPGARKKQKEAKVFRRNKMENDLRKVKKDLEVKNRGLQKANQGIKALYKELERANAELKKLNQVKSDFISSVSHELRTPLAIIKEGICLILDGILGDVNDKQKKTLAMSKANIDRLASIISDLLDISRIEAGKLELKKEIVDVTGIVKDVCEKWKLVLDKKRQILSLSLPSRPVNITVDHDRITEVVINLISNANRYTPEKGRIKVELKERDNGVEIDISDDGVGISRDNLPRIFDKFAQIDRAVGPGSKGTGLGLAITKQLVELHKGTIKVESRVNKGSTFRVFLPRF